jgi:hypothetical protein
MLFFEAQELRKIKKSSEIVHKQYFLIIIDILTKFIILKIKRLRPFFILPNPFI